MRKIATIMALCLFVLGTMPGPAWANTTYHSPSGTSGVTVNLNTGALSVQIFESGLGNDIGSVNYTLTATATYTVGCVNRGGKTVQGQPKTGSGSVGAQTVLTARNGQTKGAITLPFALTSFNNPGCTGSQRAVLLGATYTNVVLNDNLGNASPIDPTATFGQSSGLFIIII